MNKKLVLQSAATLLTIATALHFIRVLAGWDVSIANWAVPAWLSAVLVIIAGYLAIQMWKLAK